jgi:hypothetical protein
MVQVLFLTHTFTEKKLTNTKTCCSFHILRKLEQLHQEGYAKLGLNIKRRIQMPHRLISCSVSNGK